MYSGVTRMIEINCSQGSEEWFKSRAGCITASMFEECRKRLKSGKNKGDFTEKAKEYAFRLAVERISGDLLSEDKFDTFEMKRGRELEPTARKKHEERRFIKVREVGMSKTDDLLFGASVDGMIGDEGSCEYKCFISPKSIMPIILDDDISHCIDQVQGQLWITERKWSDFVLYCPALESIGKDLTITRVERDEEYIEGLKKDLLEFNELVNQYQDKLTG